MKFILCALSLFVFTSTALAEETIRKEGDKSINFSLVRSELQRYKYGFGGKYWTSSDIAYAASIDISRNETDSNDSTGGTSTSSDSSGYALSFAIEKHLQTSSKLSPYFGGELKYSRFSDEYSSDYASSSYHSAMHGKEYGVAVLAGAEYALNKNISLAGEYAYGFSYSTSKYNSDYNNQNTRSKGFDLSVGRLTLLLYF